ncbi:SNF2-related protein [Nitzschia inconspicua]|uniref:SNF2-related protein n=1 Tax=Nitzschia inconspicua TaxID=303405 RepID=A0A9K3PUC6_9STRA|nr:SNF2-related protein [Nitzschia inconspicua]
MPKEDRSSWVAVAPEFSSDNAGEITTPKIKPAQSAYTFFQKAMTEQVKAEHISANNGKFEVGLFSRAMREKWNELDEEGRKPFEDLAVKDQYRFRSESHAADVAAIERRERLQREREMLMLDDEGGTKRSTRGQRAKKERKQKRKEKKKHKHQTKKKKHTFGDDEDDEDDEDFVEERNSRVKNDHDMSIDEEEDEGSDDFSVQSDDDSSDSSSSDSEGRPKKKKAKPAPRAPSQKQIERRLKLKQEKEQKEAIVAERQEDIRKDRASQAKKRLEYLLKQSDIFSHFGAVKQDQAKFGIKSGEKKSSSELGLNRRELEDDQEVELEEADEHHATRLTAQPTSLGFGKMRDYQLEGLNWMIRLQENGVNGILADEMGLGKTLQSISILVYMMEYQNDNGPHIIIVPKSTLSNWMNELSRWAPTLKVVKFHGDKTSRDEISNNILCPGQKDEKRTWNVCVTTYEVCNIEKNVLNKFAWSYLIIDEAHRLKNEASTFSQTVRMFETRYRILLTGTPLQNSLHELWALLNFLVPDVFASSEQFDEWFNLDIEDNAEKNRLISQLHKILRPFMLRRLKKEVETSLPPKHETILFTGMSAMQKKLYRDILIRDIDAIQGTSGNRTAILNIVMQLRKCAGHPYLFPGVEDRTLPPLGEHLVENCGKMVLLDKLLKRLQENGHRVLLFTQMTRILDIMEDYMVMRRFKYCRIDGNTSYELREDYIDAFNAPGSDKFIFLLSTRAGGLGINLQTADVVILYDSDWNPQADLQAQDRAHRIGQKREVQVFRFVTEHTIEEKIVERAQQKLKLDAMVVQQGRLKDKDNKLSRDELLEAVRFGADKIFKSKDSSITDEDIDLIINAGKQKTQELNEKLKAADKGDLLDFKLDGSSNMQTFEGIDYSNNALAAAKAEAELLGILDVGKRERKQANYNENKLYAEQMAAMQGKQQTKKKKKVIKLPKSLRLPRMEEWHMYNRARLLAIQEEEEKAFHALPEDVQKLATMKKEDIVKVLEESSEAEPPSTSPKPSETTCEADDTLKNTFTAEGLKKATEPLELPPLISDEIQREKDELLAEGFSDWTRFHYTAFIKASAKHGRANFAKIALEVGKSEEDTKKFVDAFWGDIGKERFSEHEYERVVNLIAKGEKKIVELKALERGTRVLISLFENPWEELEFTHVNTKDKLFSADNDRYLLCWTHKYGYGQWAAIKMAIRRSPKFRFDYFLRSLPIDMIGRRCEHLMRAALKEVEQLEKKVREDSGLPVEAEEDKELPPVLLPKFKEMQKRLRQEKIEKREKEKKVLQAKVDDLEAQMQEIQDRLKALSKDPEASKENRRLQSNTGATTPSVPVPEDAVDIDETKAALGPNGEVVEFPYYDGSEPPKEPKKTFAWFCNRTRKEVKASLNPEERKDKEKVNEVLRDRFMSLSEDEKKTWREWASWDKKRYVRDLEIYESVGSGGTTDKDQGQKKRRKSDGNVAHVPKKQRKQV